MLSAFDFDAVEVAPLPITPVWGGTPNVYLTKVDVVAASDTASARLDFLLERKEPGKRVEKSRVSFWDWTGNDADRIRESTPANEMKRMVNTLMVFRPDLDDLQTKVALGYKPGANGQPEKVTLWVDMFHQFVASLPLNMAQVGNTWYLRYKENGKLDVPLNWFVVKAPGGTFAMDVKYDLMSPPAAVIPTPAAAFATDADPFGAQASEAPSDLPF